MWQDSEAGRCPLDTPTFTVTSKPAVHCTGLLAIFEQCVLPVEYFLLICRLYSAFKFFPEWDNVLELRRTSVSNELRYVVRCRDDSLFSAIASQREFLLHRKTSPLQWRAYFIYQKRASFFIISDSLSSCGFLKSYSPMKTVALCPQCNGSSINTNRDGRCVASEGTLSASSSTIITQTHILSAWAAPPHLLPPPPPLWSILTLFLSLHCFCSSSLHHSQVYSLCGCGRPGKWKVDTSCQAKKRTSSSFFLSLFFSLLLANVDRKWKKKKKIIWKANTMTQVEPMQGFFLEKSWRKEEAVFVPYSLNVISLFASGATSKSWHLKSYQ